MSVLLTGESSELERNLHSLEIEVGDRIQSDSVTDLSLIDPELAIRILKDPDADVETLLRIAELPRRHFHQNRVLVHILNNIRNGNCAEDCGYCAQRKTADGVPVYQTKPDEEILEEALAAKKNGAHRYCLVTAGRGTSPRMAEKYAGLIQRINQELGLKVCLSGGLINDPEAARILADAGLDRYNHNLNTSDSHYGEIATTHTYQDRLATLEHVSSRGISLCSGVIAGMGEKREDLVEVAFELKRLNAASIPVNFFLPIEGHAVAHPEDLRADDCLKILSIFRLINPTAELRMAAGREMYLGERQADGLRVANSLFVSGYLNVRGSSAEQTIRMIYENGYRLDEQCEKEIVELRDLILADNPDSGALKMKGLKELRPFKKD